MPAHAILPWAGLAGAFVAGVAAATATTQRGLLLAGGVLLAAAWATSLYVRTPADPHYTCREWGGR